MKVERVPAEDYYVRVTLTATEAKELSSGLNHLLRFYDKPGSVWLPQTTTFAGKLAAVLGAPE